jgi:hypothetical protein
LEMKVVGGPCTTAGAVETTGLSCILHLTHLTEKDSLPDL